LSNKSSSDQVISLPQGGGALHGIGETFAPDLFTGTGNFTVPIGLPPGRKAFQPQLSLIYSTGNGNGPFGLGWSLSIPGVSRKTSRGIPRYEDEKDTFLISGAEDLVQVEENAGAARFRPRTEGLFARIEHFRDADTDHWEVRSRDGLISVYGTPASLPNDPAVIANPEERNQIFQWNLTETKDPFENTIRYEYERNSGDTEDHFWDQLYLQRLRYVDYADPASSEVEFLVSVTFTY
jgi:Salmonella virulence plasmid 65kDa B protein